MGALHMEESIHPFGRLRQVLTLFLVLLSFPTVFNSHLILLGAFFAIEDTEDNRSLIEDHQTLSFTRLVFTLIFFKLCEKVQKQK